MWKKGRKEKKKRGRKEGRSSCPLGTTCQTQEIPVRPGQAVTQLLLLLQASLSPDGCCVGLLRVKRDVRWTTCILPQHCSPAGIIHATAQPSSSKRHQVKWWAMWENRCRYSSHTKQLHIDKRKEARHVRIQTWASKQKQTSELLEYIFFRSLT